MNQTGLKDYAGQRQGMDNHCAGFALGAILCCINQTICSGHEIYDQLQMVIPDPLSLKNSHTFWNLTGNLYTSSMRKIEGKMTLPSSIVAMLPNMLPERSRFTIYCDTDKWIDSLTQFTSNYDLNMDIESLVAEQIAEIQKYISPNAIEPLEQFANTQYKYAMMLISEGVHWVAKDNNGCGYNPNAGIVAPNWECSGLAISFG